MDVVGGGGCWGCSVVVGEMKILSVAETKDWLQNNDIKFGRGFRLERDHLESKFGIPSDAGQRVALVSKKMETFRSASRVFVVVEQWSVWPSAERMHIFERFRLSYGDSRKLMDAPAQLFTGAEFDDAVSLVTLAVLFLWDCHIVTRKGARQLFFCHDEFGLSNS